MKPELLEMYAEFARKYEYDIITIGESGATFKEYSGDGFFRIKKSRREIEKELKV